MGKVQGLDDPGNGKNVSILKPVDGLRSIGAFLKRIEKVEREAWRNSMGVLGDREGHPSWRISCSLSLIDLCFRVIDENEWDGGKFEISNWIL